MSTADLIRVPIRFYEDHESRELDTPKAVRFTKRHVFIRRGDPAIPELLNDAQYYAHPYGPDDLGLKASARATVTALQGV
jgi:hypothetical protein